MEGVNRGCGRTIRDVNAVVNVLVYCSFGLIVGKIGCWERNVLG